MYYFLSKQSLAFGMTKTINEKFNSHIIPITLKKWINKWFFSWSRKAVSSTFLNIDEAFLFFELQEEKTTGSKMSARIVSNHYSESNS